MRGIAIVLVLIGLHFSCQRPQGSIPNAGYQTKKGEVGDEDFFQIEILRKSDGKKFEVRRQAPRDKVFASFANQQDEDGVRFRYVLFSFPTGLSNFKVALHGDTVGKYVMGEVKGIYLSQIVLSLMLDGEFKTLTDQGAEVSVNKIRVKESEVPNPGGAPEDGLVDIEGTFAGLFSDGKQEYEVTGSFRTWGNTGP